MDPMGTDLQNMSNFMLQNLTLAGSFCSSTVDSLPSPGGDLLEGNHDWTKPYLVPNHLQTYHVNFFRKKEKNPFLQITPAF